MKTGFRHFAAAFLGLALTFASVSAKETAEVSGAAVFKKEIKFHVSRVDKPGFDEDRETLVKVFNALNEDLAIKGAKKLPGRVIRDLGEDKGYILLIENKPFHLAKAALPEIPVGEPVEAWFRPTGGEVELEEPVLDASKVRSIEIIDPLKPVLTKEAFVKELKDGKDYRVVLLEMHQCPTCLGIGELGNVFLGTRRTCPMCHGDREIEKPFIYTIVW